MATFDVSLVTPDGPVYEGEIEMLIVPGADGEIGVLARHAPLIAMLNAGSTRVHVKRETEVLEFATGPGFFKVEQDRALALVDRPVGRDERDVERGHYADTGSGSGSCSDTCSSASGSSSSPPWSPRAFATACSIVPTM